MLTVIGGENRCGRSSAKSYARRSQREIRLFM
jgi:hypothetical protein